MNGFGESVRGFFLALAFIARTTATNVAGHWALAIFSLVAAGGIWIVIQDIENPRVEGLVPDEAISQGIPVEFVNLSPDFVVEDTARVRVRVQAREEDIPLLRPADFRATVDLQGIESGFRGDLPVTVESLDQSVTVLAVVPSRVRVDLVRVAEAEFPVEVNVTGALPTGFEETEARVIDPPFVMVTGRPDLVANVDSVEVDVNLSGQRERVEITGELVARNSNGDRQTVTLSESRATVAFTIEQRTVERTVAVRARTTGTPSPGYRVSSVAIDPPFVTVTGPVDVVDGLTELTLEPIDLNGATSAITQTRTIQTISQVDLGRDSVRVDVGIEPIVCEGGRAEGECGAFTYSVAPSFTGTPQGLSLAPGGYAVRVSVAGPLTLLTTLTVADIQATVPLDGLSEGTSTVQPQVELPGGLTVSSVEPIDVTLQPEPLP